MACYFNYFVDSIECSDDEVILKNHAEKDVQIVLTECCVLPDNISECSFNICSSHFSHILERNLKRSRRIYCEVPACINTHPESKSTRRKDRLLTFSNVVSIRENFGVIIPAGTPVCANCRRKLCYSTNRPKESIQIVTDFDTCLSKSNDEQILGRGMRKHSKDVEMQVHVTDRTDDPCVFSQDFEPTQNSLSQPIENTKIQIPSISAMNNFKFEENGIRVWKHYKIGPGKFIPCCTEETVVPPSLEVLEKARDNVDFHALVQSSVQSVNQQSDGIFTCSNDGCMSSFNSHQELHDHAILDECNVQSEKIKKSDVLKTQYIKKLSETQVTSKEVTLSGNCSEIESRQTLSQGWGIKLERKNRRFTENQKSFLIERFNIGVHTGRKEDPENVSLLMRSIKKSDGSRRFVLTEFLSSQQIASFFSRHCRKMRL